MKKQILANYKFNKIWSLFFYLCAIIIIGFLITSFGLFKGNINKNEKIIALLLAESKTARYESHDRPLFEKKVKSLCHDCNIIYSNANQDADRQQSQAEAALANGAKVIVLNAVDIYSSRAIAEKTKSQNVFLIAYDRLIQNTDAIDFYISFDSYHVGELQGLALLDTLSGKKNPQIVMINGSPTDNNATLNKAGAHSILDGKVKIAKEYDTPDWSPDKAQEEMTQALTALNNKVDGVRAANDGTAGGVIAAIKATGIKKIPPVTGQDAELAAIQRILKGEQYMTVFKTIKKQAEIAAEVAVHLLCQKTLPKTIGNIVKVNNGKSDIPSILLEPVLITRDNIKETVIKEGFWTIDQICTDEYWEYCLEANLFDS